MSRVLIIGAGDMGERLAHGLAASGHAREIVLADPSARLDIVAATLASSHDVTVHALALDAREPSAIATALRRHPPDLVVQTASLMSPWALVGRDDPVATAFASAGLGVRLPLQLPVLLATMRAVREVGFAGPVANLSLPDLTNPILHAARLAPTLGLGNVSMLLVRARAALRRELGPESAMPLLRLTGQHHHVYGVMQSSSPSDPASGPWVWVGDEQATRRDELAYRGPAIEPGIVYNAVTAAAALPVLLALLPGAEPLRWSTPAPHGLPGGYPVRIADGTVSLDLPAGVELSDCRAMCEREAKGDGVDHIDDDGTVHFTSEVRDTMHAIAPDLVEPMALDDVDRRAERILALLAERA